MQKTDSIVIGGGLVGMATAYGLSLLGRQVVVVDEGDSAFRAARGNFGLLWVQGKGHGMSAYTQWTQASVRRWPRFAAMLLAETGIDLQLKQSGGFQLCLSEAELSEEARLLHDIRAAQDIDYPFEVLDQAELRKRLPGIGPGVFGACYSPMDGHVNPLKLLHALHAACKLRGVKVLNGLKVNDIQQVSGGFEVTAGPQRLASDRLVLAAGLGNRALAALFGQKVPLEPSRGQILVTERLKPFLHFPTTYVRQTDEGSVQLGDSAERVGFDDRTSVPVMSQIAGRAVACFPQLEHVRVVRAWGSLRVLSPDGAPIYEDLTNAPGCFVVSCHSGVTLAAAHALKLAPWIAGVEVLPAVSSFSLQRFTPSSKVAHAY
ncbi:FAD-dependent oxidoreductase [Pseudomonas kielensis]|uniref:NAD(P)/FAD-dependent oxidoreductase n=1 Tax=Pseudomonas TaxID=286 RepID=UPI0014126E66|nr:MULTISPECIES: FAD-dependent oxidoreductase [Pseudomonas]NBB32517.1 FAD-dependent oxidoreductase [Pseudomonas sp. BC115LW]WKL54914.1 FAD-dependent oxidoreductase [Pseudomonas kielensis]